MAVKLQSWRASLFSGQLNCLERICSFSTNSYGEVLVEFNVVRKSNHSVALEDCSFPSIHNMLGLFDILHDTDLIIPR